MNIRDNAIHCEAKNLIMPSVGAVAVVCMGAHQALIDTNDIGLVAPLRWSITKGKSGPVYARAYAGTSRADAKNVRMHRFILGLTSEGDVDHINGDGLDNRRSNLRLVTRAENLMNTGAFAGSKSKIRGVCWYPNYQKWRAYIMVNRKTITLGYFDTIEEAASARKAGEDQYFPGARRR